MQNAVVLLKTPLISREAVTIPAKNIKAAIILIFI